MSVYVLYVIVSSQIYKLTSLSHEPPFVMSIKHFLWIVTFGMSLQHLQTDQLF